MDVIDRFRLHDRVACVTGANRGLGKAMAISLAEAGASVAITSRAKDRAEEAASKIAEETGKTVCGYECDVTDANSVADTVSSIVRDFGQIDIVINNAGVNVRGPIDELDLEDFRKVQETNVTGVWLMCREIAPHLKAQQYGRVVNLGSTLSVVGMADRTPYTSSKGAVLQMTRTLALEWAPFGITVNAILPGPFATEMNKPLLDDPETYRHFAAQVPLGRWGELEEIGGLAVFLASDASSFVTGAAYAIDGGWTAR